MRNYIMKADDGHDTQYLIYQSEYRNGSRMNRMDAEYELIKRYGYREARNWQILDTRRTDRTEC